MKRSTLACLAGLVVGIIGLVVQASADPARFTLSSGFVFPPGIAFIVGAGVLVVLTARWWWHPVFAVFIAFWIVGVGSLAGQMQPNLSSTNTGTVVGTLVMSAGLVFAGVVGIAGAVQNRRQPVRR